MRLNDVKWIDRSWPSESSSVVIAEELRVPEHSCSTDCIVNGDKSLPFAVYQKHPSALYYFTASPCKSAMFYTMQYLKKIVKDIIYNIL